MSKYFGIGMVVLLALGAKAFADEAPATEAGKTTDPGIQQAGQAAQGATTETVKKADDAAVQTQQKAAATESRAKGKTAKARKKSSQHAKKSHEAAMQKKQEAMEKGEGQKEGLEKQAEEATTPPTQ
ncbi:MAG TPA: hypothetical protein VI895_11815 [Bdellovibrionota bacterium]|nr:hypothetical protein [Bdellovibrionota bacterium]